ncbi:MAG: ester cyclase [Rubrobacteraceae bacterium]
MSLDGYKDVSRRSLEMWASGNSDDPDEIFVEDYVNHQEPDLEGGVSEKSLEDWKALLDTHEDSFSDFEVRILMQVAEDDLVTTYWEFTATHTGEFLGLSPTGKELTWTGVSIDRFREGKIAETWVVWDKYRQFEELGLVN